MALQAGSPDGPEGESGTCGEARHRGSPAPVAYQPGPGVAVIQSVGDYEKAQDEPAFMRAVVAGLADLAAGREVTLDEAKARLSL